MSPVLLLAIGCTRWQVQPLGPAQLVEERHPAQVRLERADGSRLVLRAPAVRSDSLISQRGTPRRSP